MPISVTYGSPRYPAASERLAHILRQQSNLDGQLYIGFPILPSSEEPQPIDALLLFRDGGMILFDLIDGEDPGEYGQRQDDAYNRMEARLRLHPTLMDQRRLRIDIETLSFAPGCSRQSEESDNSLVSSVVSH